VLTAWLGFPDMAKTLATPFTGDIEADRLLSTDGFALLVGMLLDQHMA
jgi:hypothetical protein